MVVVVAIPITGVRMMSGGLPILVSGVGLRGRGGRVSGHNPLRGLEVELYRLLAPCGNVCGGLASSYACAFALAPALAPALTLDNPLSSVCS